MTERVQPLSAAGDLDPIEVTPAGDPVDPNGAPSPVYSVGELEFVLAPPAATAPESADSGDSAAADEPLNTGANRRQWRFFPRTLAGRLVIGVVALVLIVVLAAGVATYTLLGSFLTDRLDQQVGSAADANLRGVSRCVTIVPASCSLGFTGPGSTTATSASGQALRGAQRLWVALLDPSGRSLSLASDSPDLLLLDLNAAQRASITNSPGNYHSVTSNGVAVRLTARPISTNAGVFIEVIGLSNDDVTNTLNRLLLLELAIGAGAVVLAVAATSFGVRFSLRPLNRVTNTARVVAAELSPEGAGLERRVQVADPKTEVGQLAESVNTLLGAVGTQFAARVESEQRMRQFMADASHELRTPLTSIRGYAELARMQRAFDGGVEGSPPSLPSDAEALQRIENEGTRMSRLVEDLLTLARGDIGAPIESQPVDVAELIDEAVEGAQAAYPDRYFGLSVDAGTTVHGDHGQLLRVIRNLVTNAAVHTAAGRPIRVAAVREGAQVIIEVIDGGPGLPPEQAAHVFERFWRSDASRARTSGGSGLGLAIVASIVAAHGGKVSFESSVEAGSVVTVSLPAR